MQTKTQKKVIGFVEFTLISDIYDGQVLDTQVKIGENTLCWIAGESIEQFFKDIVNTVGKHAI